jgi:thiol-disulfide isomerase/thioredoxin
MTALRRHARRLHPFAGPVTALDVAVPLGCAIAGLAMLFALQFLDVSGLATADPIWHGVVLRPSLASSAAAALAHLDQAALLVAFAALAAGVTRRGGLALAAAGVVIVPLARWYADPLSFRSLSSAYGTDDSVAGTTIGGSEVPGSPSTWTAPQLLSAWATYEVDGRPIAQVRRERAIALLLDGAASSLAWLVAFVAFVPRALARRKIAWWIVVPAQAAALVVAWRLQLAVYRFGAPREAWVFLGAACALAAAGALLLLARRLGLPMEEKLAVGRARLAAAVGAVSLLGLALLAAWTVVRTPGGLRRLVPAVAVGRPAPDLELATPDGGRVRTRPGGEVVVLTHFATWCGPCRREIPELARMQQEWGAAGLRVLAVSSEDAATLRAHAAEAELAVTIAHATPELLAALPERGFPTTWMIGRDGLVRHVHVGYAPRVLPKLLHEIEALLAEETASR